MSNELAVQSENELIRALQASVYVDADLDTIKLVISYCKSMKIDPMIKPVHIVRIKDKNVLFPSIALHRIRAHRSGTFVGMGEPVYGEDVTEKLGNDSRPLTYPKTCSVIIKKKVGNDVAEFCGNAVWKECFQKTNTGGPNVFWLTRPYSQLFKCAEADALKRAFPEIAGAMVTVEEYNPALNEVDITPASPQQAINNTADSIKAQFNKDTVNAMLSKPEIDCNVNFETGEVIENENGSKTVTSKIEWGPDTLSMNQSELLSRLKKYISAHKLSVEKVAQLKAKYGASAFGELNCEQLQDILDGLNEESK